MSIYYIQGVTDHPYQPNISKTERDRQKVVWFQITHYVAVIILLLYIYDILTKLSTVDINNTNITWVCAGSFVEWLFGDLDSYNYIDIFALTDIWFWSILQLFIHYSRLLIIK